MKRNVEDYRETGENDRLRLQRGGYDCVWYPSMSTKPMVRSSRREETRRASNFRILGRNGARVNRTTREISRRRDSDPTTKRVTSTREKRKKRGNDRDFEIGLLDPAQRGQSRQQVQVDVKTVR